GRKGEPVKPKFLQGEILTEPSLPEGFQEAKFQDNTPPQPPFFSRKDQLADWIVRSDNPYFARAIANRLWGQYLGRGAVHPVDNMSESNEPSHPEVLNELTAWRIEHGFDLRAYTRELVNSKTYQLSSAGSTGEAQPMWFQHARSRPLSAEELAASWRVATGFAEREKSRNESKAEDRFRPLTRDYVLRFF